MSIAISNGHARATVLSAVWSPQDQQLVAVLLAAPDKLALTALKAELEKHNKNSFVALSGDAKAELAGAKRGYVHVSQSLEKVHAQGHVLAMLHWKAHDPRLVQLTKTSDAKGPAEAGCFYVVARHGDCLPALFLERLQLALAWPMQPTWAEALLHLGLEAELVEFLPVGQPADLPMPVATQRAGLAFQAAIRVVKAEERWGEIIAKALQAKTITL